MSALRECKNTEFVWELKRDFKQGGRKTSCPLTRVSVKRASTVTLINILPAKAGNLSNLSSGVQTPLDICTRWTLFGLICTLRSAVG